MARVALFEAPSSSFQRGLTPYLHRLPGMRALQAPRDEVADVLGPAGLQDSTAGGVCQQSPHGLAGCRAERGVPAPLGPAGTNALDSQDEFTRLSQFAKVQAPPPVKFKDLEEVVSSRILRNQISFDYRFDFMRITGDTILVPVTVQIQNKQMTFRDHDGVQSASLNLFGRISSMTGRVIQTFEDVIQRDFPDSLLEPSLKGFSIYQKAVPLRPGLYKLDLVIKDVNSGNVGVVNTKLAVSPIPDDKLEASSLIALCTFALSAGASGFINTVRPPAGSTDVSVRNGDESTASA